MIRRILIALAILVALVFQLGVFGAHGFQIGMFWLLLQVVPIAILRMRHRTLAHRTIAARADYEHAAILRGEYSLGLYGAYQPTHTHEGQN